MASYLHLKRYRQIVNAFARQGFGYLLDQMGLGEMISWAWQSKDPEKHRLSFGARLRQVMEELGPAFIKLGQMLSTRGDLLPQEVIRELAKLQDRVPPFPFLEAKEIMQDELGASWEKDFRWVEPEPLAAASIGQVHRAELADGRQAVIKVRRPGVEQSIKVDLEIVVDLARLAENRLPKARFYHLVELMEEFARTIKLELDYTQEGRNSDRLRKNLARANLVRIPETFWQYTTARVLTMEYLAGIKLNNLNELDHHRIDRCRVAKKLIEVFLQQILLDGFFHADPHPGNLAVLPDQTLVLLDFGVVGRLSEEQKIHFGTLVLGITSRSSSQVIRALARMGILSADMDTRALRRDVDLLSERYYDLPLGQIRLGEVFVELLDLAFIHQLRIPSELALIVKSLVTVEGIIRELHPQLSMVEIAQPMAGKLMGRRLAPGFLARQAEEYLGEYSSMALEFPRKIDRLVTALVEGRLSLGLSHHNLDQVMRQMEKMANRLSFSLVLLAFSIVMAGLLVATALSAERGRVFLWGLPFLEVSFILASVMVALLCWAIFRSGRI
ncbi:MAG: AarF/ABC1/UbiB kinase family protein [Syntrophomonadaceae bacterium]|nr:AarF/ABC1/UbiB kinase family protein [Syntrophomonadaceae bacterium]